jgi:gp16 family phage-associated protein
MEDFLRDLAQEKKTIADWSRERGFDMNDVYMVVRGASIGKRGKSRAILEAMGIELPPMHAQHRGTGLRQRAHKPHLKLLSTGETVFLSPIARNPILIDPARHEIGRRLKLEVVRLGMTAEKAASIGGISRTAQYDYEKGLTCPDAAYLELLDKRGLDVLYVVTGRRYKAAKAR